MRPAFWPLGSRILDVGCGEGATLFHLGQPEGATGLDLFAHKVCLRAGNLASLSIRGRVGSAYKLPLGEGAFDHVIVRDLIQ